MSAATLVDRQPIREAAYAALGDVTAIERALELANIVPAALPDPVDGDAAFEAAIRAAKTAVLNGEKIPASIAHSTAVANAGRDEPRLRDTIRIRVIAELQSEREVAFRRGADQALTVLAGRLEETLADVRTLAPRLHGSRSEQEAHDHGSDAAAAWKQLEAAVDDYDTVRSTQDDITVRALKLSGDSFLKPAAISLWRDSINICRDWVQRRWEFRNSHHPESEAADAYVAWLNSSINTAAAWDTSVARPWWPSSDTTGHLLWLATAGQPWVPTLDELRAAYRAATNAITTITRHVPANAADARDAYFQVTAALDTADVPHEPTDAPANMMRQPTITMRRRVVSVGRGAR